SSVTAADTAVY
nr:immunoglobulin heavy chain junction region [Homo sapiens]